ncbi:MAG: hypothetical protein DWQ37_23880 [Planctomycetota bacterium]|nr:MAG: hypothetical protein DWQ37_23880 [Planctomycetota bacterium]
MIRRFSFASTSSSRSDARGKRARVHLEPLEERRMLDAAFINEIYFDPPGGADATEEYIELRGTPGMSLADHYLIFLENENTAANDGNPGQVELVYDLSAQSIGDNGFFVLRQAGNSYAVAPDTNEMAHTGQIENSGFTAMLIRDDSGTNAPTLGQNLDVDNNGLDHPSGTADWTITDSIGVHSENGEAQFGRLYGQINYGPEPSTNIEPGATYVGLGFEIEYVGRWGNSTGQEQDNWHASNLTDNVLSGYTGTGDYRQSADPHGSTNVESSKDVVYGTNLTDTLGGPNRFEAPEVLINEIYLDPPSGGDVLYEYIELRGTPGMSLDDHFLIFLENEMVNETFGNAGEIEIVYDLSGQSLGSNGYLIIAQTGHPYTIAPGTTVITQTDIIENSGFTAMLLRNNGDAGDVPVDDELFPVSLDVDHNGLDVKSGHINWDILDSIGIHSEDDEPPFGRLYGMINFGPGLSDRVEPGTEYYPSFYPESAGFFEIEYVARWGNSTGHAEEDWHVSNLTDNLLSGFSGPGDWRQSAEPHGGTNVESNQGVAYGTPMTNTLGEQNMGTVGSVAGRQIFYNLSKFDGNTSGASASDDAAIATDKSAYLPGSGPATFANITSYTRGINGIMFDIADSAGTLTVNDFEFKMSEQVGANNTPSTWAAAPDPITVSVRSGAGAGGSDRVELIWPAGEITNRWLEVTVKGFDIAGGFNMNTGLVESDIFYFGNRIGETGSGTPGLAITSAVDEIAARNNAGFGATVTNLFDFDRSGLVNAVDSISARNNSGLLTKINISDPPAAPAPSGAGDIALGLAAPAAWDEASETTASLESLEADDPAPVVAEARLVPSSGGFSFEGLQVTSLEAEVSDELLDALLGDLS